MYMFRSCAPQQRGWEVEAFPGKTPIRNLFFFLLFFFFRFPPPLFLFYFVSVCAKKKSSSYTALPLFLCMTYTKLPCHPLRHSFSFYVFPSQGSQFHHRNLLYSFSVFREEKLRSFSLPNLFNLFVWIRTRPTAGTKV